MTDYPFFPLFVDLSDKHILIIGAGTIAARRVKTLLNFCPFIRVVAPEVCPDMERLIKEHDVQVFRRLFATEDLDETNIVLAATNNARLNAEIAVSCKERGIPVNVCSDRGMCDFYFPGIVQDNNIVIGITASGKDHHAVKRIQECILHYCLHCCW